jgi:hypothetical protein
MRQENKPWIIKVLFYFGIIFIISYVTYIISNQSTIELANKVPEYKEFVTKHSNISFFDKFVPYYFPMLVFGLSLILLIINSKKTKTRKISISLISTFISMIIFMLLSKRYWEYSTSWYFTPQVTILINFGLGAYFIIAKMNKIKSAILLFILIILYFKLDSYVQQLIMKIKYSSDLIFTFSKSDLVSLIILSGLTLIYFFIEQNKYQLLKTSDKT